MRPSKKTTQFKCHGEDKHHNGSQFGEGCWGLQWGCYDTGGPCWARHTVPVCFFLLLAAPLLPDKPQSPSGASSWLPGRSEYGLAVDINHRKCWRCDFYHLVCSMMLIHPIISSYINMCSPSHTHAHSASA